MKLHHLSPFFFLFAMSSVACSSSSDTPAATPCNVDPWQCPAGQTCWPKDNTGAFACLNSAAGKVKGDVCKNSVGTPTCGDGLACLQLTETGNGQCVSYCDNATVGRGCAAGETCTTITLQKGGNSFQACVGTSTPMDSGTETSTDTGSDSAATDTGTSSDSAATETGGDAAGD